MASYRIKVKPNINNETYSYYPEYRWSKPKTKDSIYDCSDGFIVFIVILLTIVSFGLIWLIVLGVALFTWEPFTVSELSSEPISFSSEVLARKFINEQKSLAEAYSKEKERKRARKKKKTRYINLN